MAKSVVAERPAAGGRPPSERAQRQRDDQRLMRRHKNGDTSARDELIERYMPLARSLALRYRRASEPLDDLVQVASVGLVKAVDRWDPERGLAFSSYAVPTILGELRRYFRDATWDVRPARDLQELCLSVEEAREALWAELGRSPTVADIAAHLKVTEEEVLEGLEGGRAYAATSLSTPVDDGTLVLGDTLGAEDSGFELTEHLVSLKPALATLDERERTILSLRFYGNLSQSEIGEQLGISQMHVSRLLTRAVGKLRSHLLGDVRPVARRRATA
jgi:RNA polymerase sigma-B factor